MNRTFPRVAICFPSSDMVHADFALALAGLCNATQPIETPVVNNKSSIVAMARNNGVKCAQDMGADFILFLDSDMTFPLSHLPGQRGGNNIDHRLCFSRSAGAQGRRQHTALAALELRLPNRGGMPRPTTRAASRAWWSR